MSPLQTAEKTWPLGWRQAPSGPGHVTLCAEAGPLLRSVRVDIDEEDIVVHFLWFDDFDVRRTDGDLVKALEEARSLALTSALRQVEMLRGEE